nr:hypothetical protein [Paracoccus stylophorae]
MTSNAACWRHPVTALVVATSLLTACATGGSDPGGAVCPPVVAYDQVVRERAAAELEALSEGAALVGMMADYVVMRAQARACAS